MMLAHYAVGFAAKRAAPRASLTMLVMAGALSDVIFPVLVLLGVEKVRVDPGHTAFTPFDFYFYPFSHSLLATLVWAGLLAWIYHARTRYSRGALMVGLAAASHWLLDLISHGPDMPLAPGLSVILGLGLWNSIPGTIAVELALLAIGLWLYASTTRARSRMGHLSLWSLAALLVFTFVGGSPGATPPSIQVMGLVSFVVLVVLFLWLTWIDRTRELRPAFRPVAPAATTPA